MTKLDELEAEAKVVVEVRCVDDDYECVRLALAFLAPEKHITRDRFIRTCRFEAVGARKVDHLDRTAIAERQTTRMSFNRDSWVIAHLLPSAGQRVEQRALAGIGTAGDGDERKGVHKIGWT
jgi:hypothetical protein